MPTSPLILLAVLTLVAALAILLLRKGRQRDRGGLKLDFHKAKELESRKRSDLQA